MFAGIKRFCREIDQPNSIFFDRLELPRFDTHSNNFHFAEGIQGEDLGTLDEEARQGNVFGGSTQGMFGGADFDLDLKL